jgi:hypothetical protein
MRFELRHVTLSLIALTVVTSRVGSMRLKPSAWADVFKS